MSAQPEPTADEPTADEPTADEPTADEPTADEPTADEPTADEIPAEGGGGGSGEPPPPEPPDEQLAQPLSEKAIERRMQSLEKEATRHANRVSDILAEDAQDLEPCPLCWPFAPGFILPAYFAANADEIRATVRAAWGEQVEPEYAPASNARQCEACHGLGKRLSGSQVPATRLLLCDTCEGAGYVKVGSATPHPDFAAGNGGVVPEPVVVGEEQTTADPWGREPGHVDYGRLPQYVGTFTEGG